MRRAEILGLQSALKQLVASRGFNLKDLGGALDVSIATAKRLLNSDDLSVERILQICDWLGVGFYEVVEIAAKQRAEYHFCSEAQEEFLAARPSHFAYLRALQKGSTPKSIAKTHKLSASDTKAYLIDLESEGFLRRTDGDEIIMVVRDGMDWRPDGPLWRTYFSRWSEEFASHMQTRSGAEAGIVIDISQRKLSARAFAEMRREIDDLSRRYASLSKIERQLHPEDELADYTCMMLADEWTAPLWRIQPYNRG